MCHHQSMGDLEDEPGLPAIRPAAPDEEFLAGSRAAPSPRTMVTGTNHPAVESEGRNQRRARMQFLLATALAGLAWLGVGLLVLMAMAAYHADVSDNLTGFAVAGLLPLVLVAAFGLTAASAWCYRGIRGGRASLVIAIAAAAAAVICLCYAGAAT